MINFNDPFTGVITVLLIIAALGWFVIIFGKVEDKNPKKKSNTA